MGMWLQTWLDTVKWSSIQKLKHGASLISSINVLHITSSQMAPGFIGPTLLAFPMMLTMSIVLLAMRTTWINQQIVVTHIVTHNHKRYCRFCPTPFGANTGIRLRKARVGSEMQQIGNLTLEGYHNHSIFIKLVIFLFIWFFINLKFIPFFVILKLYLLQDPGTKSVVRHWPSINIGTEIYISNISQVAEWTVSNFDIIIPKHAYKTSQDSTP